MRRAEAVRQALIRMRSSMMWSLMLPGSVDWMMKTSSSRTDSPMEMLDSLLLYWRTMTLASSMPSLRCHLLASCSSPLVTLRTPARSPVRHELGQLPMTVTRKQLDGVGRHLDATAMRDYGVWWRVV